MVIGAILVIDRPAAQVERKECEAGLLRRKVRAQRCLEYSVKA